MVCVEFQEFDSFVVMNCGAFGTIVYDLVSDKVTINFDSEVPFDDLLRLVKILKRKVNKLKRENMELNI